MYELAGSYHRTLKYSNSNPALSFELLFLNLVNCPSSSEQILIIFFLISAANILVLLCKFASLGILNNLIGFSSQDSNDSFCVTVYVTNLYFFDMKSVKEKKTLRKK